MITFNKDKLQNWTIKSIEAILMSYGGKFVIECQYKTSDGGLSYDTGLLFWNDTPHPRGSNWYFITRHDGKILISDGLEISQNVFNAIKVNDKVLWSTSQHHCNCYDGTCIDGGMTYTKVSWKQSNFIEGKLHIIRGGDLVFVPDEIMQKEYQKLWHNVKNKLPEPKENTFRYCENQDGEPCFYNNDTGHWHSVGNVHITRGSSTKVEYWRYLEGFKD